VLSILCESAQIYLEPNEDLIVTEKTDRQGKVPISRYLNVQLAHSPSFSSDGQRLAFLTNISGLPQVWQESLSQDMGTASWPEQLTFGSNRVSGVWFSPAAGDERLIYASDVGGSENAQFYLLSSDGSSDTELTQGYEEALHIFGEWSADGRSILFTANRRHPGLFDLYVQPLDGEARLVWQNDVPGFLFPMHFSPDGQHVVLTRMASSFHHELFEVDLENHSARQLNSAQERARFNSAWYAVDGRSLYVNTDLGSDFLHIARIDLETTDVEPLIVTEHDIEFLTLSPDRKSLAYTLNTDGSDDLHFLDADTEVSRRAPRMPASPGVVAMWDRYMTFSPDSNRVAFSYTSATRTPDIHVWDLSTDRIAQVTRSSHAGIPLDSFSTPELIHFPTFDDMLIPAWYYKSRGESAAAPAIVFVHGGPASQFKPYFQFFIQYFQQHGYAILAPNVRGSTGYGKTYSHLDDVDKRMDSVLDLAHAGYWLKEQPGIDPERLVVYGGSYGGFMVLAALTEQANLWAAGVNIVGISNFVTFLENTSDYRREHREAEYGSLEHDREFLESISPLNHVDKITAPLMVIHGANDPRVPLSEAEQLVDALRDRDVPVEFLVFEDEGHGLVKLENKRVAVSATVAFLESHLSGVNLTS
jgi:dipeptidyl aminopeptidase/acylaminoacyl peptidase